MTADRGKLTKLMYLAGPQDPDTALRHLRRGEPDPSALFVPYVRQFLELCDLMNADGVVISTRPPRARMKTDRFTFYNVPNPLRSATGLRYYLGQILYGILACVLAMVHRPHVVIVCDGIMHYATIPFLRLSGAKVILAFHNTLWNSFSNKPDRWRAIAKSCHRVFTRHVAAILTTSATISEKIREVTDGHNKPIFEFLPTYLPGPFGGVSPTSASDPFHVLYVGRIMPEKGVFDMVRIARGLLDEGCPKVTITLCGQGRSEAELVAAIEQAGLREIVRYHGQCEPTELVGMYAQSHIVVVPTRTDFREGFNQVVAEAVLAGRQVVTSRVCPAVQYLDGGVTLVEPDDVDGYIRALKSAYRERDHPKQSTLSDTARGRFFDRRYGWTETARTAIRETVVGGNTNAANDPTVRIW